MYKDGILTINEWYKGMVSHPIAGFGLIENAEVFTDKGLIKPSKGFAVSNRLADGLPIAFVIDEYGNSYWATRTTVYKNNSAIITSLTNIYDIKIYKNFLFVRYNTSIGAYGELNSGSATWTASISSSFSTDAWGQLCVGQDDYLYSTNGNYIAKISVDSVALNIPTCTVTLTALDLPNGQKSRTIVEYGTKLAIGTEQGRIYTWNRQAGTLGNPGLADLPVNFQENGVWALLSHKNILYVVAGRNGNVYRSDGTNFNKLAEIPFTLSGGRAFVSYYPNAIAINSNGNLLVGNVSTNGITQAGVWEIDNNGAVVFHKLSTGKTSNNNIGVGFIFLNTSDNSIYTGWYNGASDGIDENSLTPAGTTYTFESPLFRAGNARTKKTFQHIDISLPDTLTPGESTTFSYRKNSSDDWTTIDTLSYATHGAVDNWSFTLPVADAEKIQIKGEGNVSLIDLTLS